MLEVTDVKIEVPKCLVGFPDVGVDASTVWMLNGAPHILVNAGEKSFYLGGSVDEVRRAAHRILTKRALRLVADQEHLHQQVRHQEFVNWMVTIFEDACAYWASNADIPDTIPEGWL